MNSQIRSRKRVVDHAEVFTHEREVNAMLDLVKSETERIDSRFLEPACGGGNFLIEILRRKINIIKNKYKNSQYDFERYSIIAISSIYGVDLLKDNVQECKDRLFDFFTEEYKSIFKKKYNPDYLDVIKIILDKNIVCGDALTMKDLHNKPITFSEWTMPYNDMRIKQKEYSFKDIFEPTVFWNFTTDKTGKTVMFPNVFKDHPLINYMELNKDGKNKL